MVVSDHAYMKPLKVTISASVGDVLLRPPAGDPFARASRSRAAFSPLSEVQANAEPFNVQTGLRLYTNMVCVSIRAV